VEHETQWRKEIGILCGLIAGHAGVSVGGSEWCETPIDWSKHNTSQKRPVFFAPSHMQTTIQVNGKHRSKSTLDFAPSEVRTSLEVKVWLRSNRKVRFSPSEAFLPLDGAFGAIKMV